MTTTTSARIWRYNINFVIHAEPLRKLLQPFGFEPIVVGQ
jgi:hypothetical protein